MKLQSRYNDIYQTQHTQTLLRAPGNTHHMEERRHGSRLATWGSSGGRQARTRNEEIENPCTYLGVHTCSIQRGNTTSQSVTEQTTSRPYQPKQVAASVPELVELAAICLRAECSVGHPRSQHATRKHSSIAPPCPRVTDDAHMSTHLLSSSKPAKSIDRQHVLNAHHRRTLNGHATPQHACVIICLPSQVPIQA